MSEAPFHYPLETGMMRGRPSRATVYARVLARIHHGFEKVHPFIDGNGRTGRVLLNLLLVRRGCPPVIVLKQQRPAYLAAMQRADAGEFGPLGEILARAMHESRSRFIASASTADEHRLADRRWFALDDAAWAAFTDLLERPAVFKPRLADLLAGPSDVFEAEALRNCGASYRRARPRPSTPTSIGQQRPDLGDSTQLLGSRIMIPTRSTEGSLR